MNLCSGVVYYFTRRTACRQVMYHHHRLANKRTGTDAKYATWAKNISYTTYVRFVVTSDRKLRAVIFIKSASLFYKTRCHAMARSITLHNIFSANGKNCNVQHISFILIPRILTGLQNPYEYRNSQYCTLKQQKNVRSQEVKSIYKWTAVLVTRPSMIFEDLT